MKKILYITTIALLSIIIIFNLCSLYNISLFHFRIFKVATGSMEPYLNVGDVVLIKDNAKYKENDVVTYKYKGSYITHRVVTMNDDYIVTKGDANNTVDEAVKKKDVVGKVVLKLTVLSFINYIIGFPITWILVLIIGIVLILLVPKYKKKNGKIIDNEIL